MHAGPRSMSFGVFSRRLSEERSNLGIYANADDLIGGPKPILCLREHGRNTPEETFDQESATPVDREIQETSTQKRFADDVVMRDDMGGLLRSGPDLLNVLGRTSLVVHANAVFQRTNAVDDLVDFHVEVVTEPESIRHTVEALDGPDPSDRIALVKGDPVDVRSVYGKEYNDAREGRPLAEKSVERVRDSAASSQLVEDSTRGQARQPPARFGLVLGDQVECSVDLFFLLIVFGLARAFVEIAPFRLVSMPTYVRVVASRAVVALRRLRMFFSRLSSDSSRTTKWRKFFLFIPSKTSSSPLPHVQKNMMSVRTTPIDNGTQAPRGTFRRDAPQKRPSKNPNVKKKPMAMYQGRCFV